MLVFNSEHEVSKFLRWTQLGSPDRPRALGTIDGSCLRCRITREQLKLLGLAAPIMLFAGDGHRLMIYCERCQAEE